MLYGQLRNDLDVFFRALGRHNESCIEGDHVTVDYLQYADSNSPVDRSIDRDGSHQGQK